MAVKYSKNTPINGLQTTTFNIPVAGTYTISGSLQIPRIADGDSANSAIVCTVNVNGSPILASDAGENGFYVVANIAANDVVTVVLTSGAAIDQPLNVIKGLISVS